jgi:NitT/TauT family transport system ATP-binding protein
MVDKIIDIRGIGMTYTNQKMEKIFAIDHLDMSASKGEFVSLVGPSGCGKTTLLRIIAGLLQPTKGTVWLNGKIVSGPSQNIGMIFQRPVLLEWRSIIDNVLLPIEIQKKDKSKYIDKAKELLKLSGLSGFEERSPYELSGGMAQRACICRALIKDPPLLLMDEPFSALDAFTRSQMNFELLRIWRGESKLVKFKREKENKKKTILFITHNITEAVFLSDKVGVLTCRPTKLMNTYTIPFPRPRTEDIFKKKEFVEIVYKITENIKSNFSYT